MGGLLYPRFGLLGRNDVAGCGFGSFVDFVADEEDEGFLVDFPNLGVPLNVGYCTLWTAFSRVWGSMTEMKMRTMSASW